MNYNNKTKDELIKELQKLRQEYVSLKTSYEKDITGHKLVEERQAFILRSIPLLVYCSETTDIYAATWISENVKRVTGFDQDVFLKEEYFWSSRLHPDDRDRVLKTFNRLHESEQGAIEYRWQCANGEYRWFLDSFSSFKKTLEGKIEFIGIWLDITERKQVEEALRLEKENFRRSMDDSPLGKRITTIEGETIYANKALLDFYGYNNLQELQNTPLKKRYTPESYIQARARKRQRKQGDFSTTDYEISITRKNGEIRHLQVWRKEIIWDGVNQFQVICNDITERKHTEAALKESEARFRSLFENSLIGISAASRNGRLLQANPAYARMYGFESPEKMLAEVENVGRLYANPVDRKKVLRVLTRNGFMDANEVEVIRRDGSRFFVFVSASEIRDIKGKLLFNQATHIDLTERRKIEEELRSSKELLEKLNHHLNEIRENERAVISREIHDELGQSMTALKLDLNQLLKYIGPNTEAVKKLKSMIELVSNTIKDVQRISSDLRPGILDDLGLAAAIEWYSEEFEKRSGIKCRVSFDDSIPADPQKDLVFFRVLQEALTNIIRHASASSVRIKLSRFKNSIAMSIQDNGKGMLPGIAKSGKSLGLVGMRERVRQFGGKIDIVSKKGQGTKLTIFIPS